MIQPTVSAVIPVYNDKAALENAIPAAIETLEGITDSFELIIAEDASTDGSYEHALACASRDERIRVLHRSKRLGRGSALTRAARQASGDIFCYFDVDLATDIQVLPRLIQSVADGYDMAIGSRLLPASRIVRSTSREMKSRGYNHLVRLLLGSRIQDHQCGCKAFERKKLVSILPFIHDTHWFWDTEVLIYFQRNNYPILEIPVLWTQGPGTTVKNSDIYAMGRSILSFWWSGR
ncbi:MAG TPA: glycosyltransferase [Methanospirillum sp.]|nr:glycosyltransferase [Methanospirillum sp.]